ncbi:MAG TPA: YraN family protein [Kofleriaceae bacterium]|nr:YraN family protein [Kofleriaceae bacterium]
MARVHIDAGIAGGDAAAIDRSDRASSDARVSSRAHVGAEASDSTHTSAASIRASRKPTRPPARVDPHSSPHRSAPPDTTCPRGPATADIGASAENAAIEALIVNGYYIVERNWRCDIGELDVIARDGEILVFIEVRYRADAEHGHAALMITPEKRRRVTRVAIAYLELCKPAFEECRFDVVAITGSEIDIIQDAWRLGPGSWR